MCENFLLDLNPDPYLSYPTNTYTYEMIVASRVCGSAIYFIKNLGNVFIMPNINLLCLIP